MRIVLLFVIGLLAGDWAFADPFHCAVCNGQFVGSVYLIRDKITDEQRKVCESCLVLPTRCFFCGMPVKDGFTDLKDGRFLCARDARDAVLNDDEARQICREAKNDLDRLFSRFLTFPGTNVTIALVDRVHMEQLFKFPGNDFECPNVWGYIDTKTNRDQIRYEMNLLSAMSKTELKATCAHEYTHVWLSENVSRERNKSLNRDAIEGFCELVAFMFADSQNEEVQKNLIQRNAYTRGQIHLFLEAEKQYGFYTIMEWMKSGLDVRLLEDDLDRVRRVEFKPLLSSSATVVPLPQPAPTPVPDTLTLIGISGAGSRRLALINDRSFNANESGKVRFASTNTVVHCLEIRDSSVVIQVEGSTDKQELFLKSKRGPPGN